MDVRIYSAAIAFSVVATATVTFVLGYWMPRKDILEEFSLVRAEINEEQVRSMEDGILELETERCLLLYSDGPQQEACVVSAEIEAAKRDYERKKG